MTDFPKSNRHLDVSPIGYSDLSLVVIKPVFGVSDQVRHKPGCKVTEDDERLEIYLGSRGTELSV